MASLRQFSRGDNQKGKQMDALTILFTLAIECLLFEVWFIRADTSRPLFPKRKGAR